MSMDTQRMRDELLLRGKAFYSPVTQGIANIPQKVGTGQQMLAMLMKQPEVKEAEIKDRGLHEIASRPKITREELQSLAAQRPEPQVQPVELSQDHTRYHEYQLPGGQNYRETLLTLPRKVDTSDKAIANWYKLTYGTDIASDAGPDWQSRRQDFINEMMSPEQEIAPGVTYQSPHWDHPNVLAHIRHNDRTDADGKKVLFVEEIQSDWGQRGKKEGFRKIADNSTATEADIEIKEIRNPFTGYVGYQAFPRGNDQISLGRGENRAQVMQEALTKLRSSSLGSTEGIPSGPFVTNTDHWVNLALKHVIDKAVKEGYDKVAFINGDQSADRYDLSKKVESIKYFERNGQFNVQVYPKGGTGWTSAGMPKFMSAEQLDGYIGKDLAKKIVDGEGQTEGPDPSTKHLYGLDLKVGGEGMKTFYDKIVPSALKKLLPKVGGGQIGPVNFRKSRGFEDTYTQQRGMAVPPISQTGFDVTPAMRQRVLGKGQPLYAKGGRVPSMDQMRLAVMDQKFPQMGINVTTDKSANMRYADLIVDGKKQYETRDSDSLRPYVGKRVAIVRTGEGPAKAIGAVTVGEPMTANAKKFREMRDSHLVPEGSKFDIKGNLKYLYPMIKPERFDEEQDVGHGIVSRRLLRSK